jgi:hypothetical protein
MNSSCEPFKIDVVHRYMGATAVSKDLVILLDGGNSMGGNLPGDIFQSRDFTKFTASVNIIKELLDTLNYGDRVSVISFSSSTKANLVYHPVCAQAHVFHFQYFISISEIKKKYIKFSVS